MITLLALLTACTDLPPMSYAEGTYQAVHLVDVIQTEKGPASDSCYYEANPVTAALIGKKPSTLGVVAWGAGDAIGHYAVTRWLENEGWTRAETIWQVLTIGDAGYAVGHNIALGIRLGAPDEPPASCPYRNRQSPPTVFERAAVAFLRTR